VLHLGEAFVQLGDKIRQGWLPRILAMIGQLPELFRVQAKFKRHLDVGMREAEPLSRIDPRLQSVWNNSDVFDMEQLAWLRL
jgi:hypothetical protein